MKKEYLIYNEGCDDSTLTEIMLDSEELEVIKKLAIMNNKNSHYQCQPRIYVYGNYGDIKGYERCDEKYAIVGETD